jgi:hypothetical protein
MCSSLTTDFKCNVDDITISNKTISHFAKQQEPGCFKTVIKGRGGGHSMYLNQYAYLDPILRFLNLQLQRQRRST